MSHFQIEAWLASQSQRAENALLHNLDSERSTPEQLHKAMRYAVLGGGKRIRPLLVYAASELRPKEILDQALVDTAAALRSKINANDVAVRSDLADTSSTLRGLISSTTSGLIDTASAIRGTPPRPLPGQPLRRGRTDPPARRRPRPGRRPRSSPAPRFR